MMLHKVCTVKCDVPEEALDCQMFLKAVGFTCMKIKQKGTDNFYQFRREVQDESRIRDARVKLHDPGR